MPGPECQGEIDEALLVLRAGGVVALPTDTLYGLAADVFSESALRRVFAIKGRRLEMALPVLVADWGQTELVAGHLPRLGQLLAQRFWPGSLTLVLPSSPRLSALVTGGKDTVAVRMPDHWIPIALAARLERPITGTSANRSGSADLQTIVEVEAQLSGQVGYIVRCGPAPGGRPSTVVDVIGEVPVLVRQGALPFEQVLEACR